MTGSGSSTGPAQEVADEIAKLDGRAIPNFDDISKPEGAARLIDEAVAAFGTVDIVVNNAGIIRGAPFASTTLEEFEHLWRVHARGHFLVTQRAWPHMVDKGYGRVVMTCSGVAMYGLPSQVSYSAAKGAVFGLTRSLALEAAPLGILVNAITPIARSRMGSNSSAFDLLPPELVSPVVAWLSSEICDVSGRIFDVSGGRVSEIVLSETAGYFDPDLSPESIAANLPQIFDQHGYSVPRHGVETMEMSLERAAPGFDFAREIPPT